ncbi:hypothetical protein EQP59_00075 [Ornithobacterium rhinotracheale]|uniref:Uncharacterized protein n=1 Tax=Ornithobacterium rhinotracheale TaxID=28251 RepID=A0A3R5UU93_ORNRH|nr:hypothetical protein [Ornithobacterium rhinotracheale]QAR29868.1 hypothetical protein EQP59_00075 [Ornithobacterium rhinotracheale]
MHYGLIKYYKLEKEKLECLNSPSSLSLEDLFGINRYKRKSSYELMEILKNVPFECWKKYRGEKLLKAISKLSTTDTIINDFGNNNIHGDIVIYISERTPWAWVSSNVKIPYKIAKIYVE